MNMHRALPLAVLACTAALSGCSSFSLPKMPEPWVKPYERERLAALRQSHKLSLLIVEQNLDLVLDVADRVLVFSSRPGRLAADLSTYCSTTI